MRLKDKQTKTNEQILESDPEADGERSGHFQAHRGADCAARQQPRSLRESLTFPSSAFLNASIYMRCVVPDITKEIVDIPQGLVSDRRGDSRCARAP